MVERHIWDDLAPEVKTLFMKALKNAYTGGDGNRVILVDEDGDIVTSLGGGGSAGGGSIVYTNASYDFVATPTPGANTILIEGLPYTLETIHVVGGSIKRIRAGVVSDVVKTTVTVTGGSPTGLIGLTDQEVFATGDSVYMALIGPDKWYDRNQDVAKFIMNNPDYAHYIDSENWALTDVTGLQRHIINMDSYKYWNFQYSYSQTGTQTGTMKVYYSNVASADVSSLTDWVDGSTGALGAGTIEMVGTGTNEGFKEVGPTSPLKYMLEIDITAAGTGIDVASDIYIRKFY